MAFRIPMSISQCFEITDKKNNPCKAIDAIVNPSIVSKILNKKRTDQNLMQFLFELLKNFLHEKFKMIIANEYIVLKRCKYKGSFVNF